MSQIFNVFQIVLMLCGGVGLLCFVGTAGFNWLYEALRNPSAGLWIALSFGFCGIATHVWDWMRSGNAHMRRQDGPWVYLKIPFLWIGWLALGYIVIFATLGIIALASKFIAPLIGQFIEWLGAVIAVAFLLVWAWFFFGLKECTNDCCCRRCRR